MSSTAVQVMPRAAAGAYSPATSDPSEELPNEQPLDFSKPSNLSSKTPPSSEEESDHHLPRGAAPKIDPIALTKSLAAAAAASAYFPQHPKYMKTEHCFSTPSPSPPERTHHHHFGLPVVGSPVASAAPVASSTSPEDASTAASTNAAMASQMFGLLASQFASNQTSAMINPLTAANGAINSNLLKAIQLVGVTGGSQQHQAALISALMQSAQTGTNLELLKNLTSSQGAAMHQHQQSPPKLTSPVATSTISGYLMAASQPVTTVATSNAAAAAIGLLSTAGAPNMYHHHQVQTAHHSDLMTSSPSSSAPIVDSTYRSTNQHRTSPPASSANSKYTRPFKALYNNKDSFHAQSPFTPAMAAVASSPSVATDSLATQSILLSNSDAAYQEFRNKMLVSKTRGERSPGSSHGGRPTKMADLMHHHSDDAHSVASSNSSDGLDCSSAGDSQQNVPYSVAATYPMNTSTAQSISVVSPCSQLAPSIPSPATPVMTNTNSNSSNHSGSNSASRKRGRPLPDDLKDEAYWERRRKNNEAAKRSRDLRRAKEDEIAIRAAFLEQENFKLKCELVQSRIECDKIRALWLNTQQGQAASQAQLSPTVSMTADQAALAAMLQIQKNGSPK